MVLGAFSFWALFQEFFLKNGTIHGTLGSLIFQLKSPSCGLNLIKFRILSIFLFTIKCSDALIGGQISNRCLPPELASINRPDCVTNPLNRKYGFVEIRNYLSENPQIFVAEVHKYFCFLRHSFGPSPDVYNNVLPLNLPTVYCPQL